VSLRSGRSPPCRLAFGVLLATWVALARLIEGATLLQAGIAHVLSTAVANTVPAGGAVAIGVNLRVHGSYGRTIGADDHRPADDGGARQRREARAAGGHRGALALRPRRRAAAASAALGALAFAVVAVVAPCPSAGSRSSRASPAGRRGSPPGVAGRGRPTGPTPLSPTSAACCAPCAGTDRPRSWRSRSATCCRSCCCSSRCVRSGCRPSTPGLVRVTVVYVLVRLVTALPVTPGGLGVAELGLVAGLRAAFPPGSRRHRGRRAAVPGRDLPAARGPRGTDLGPVALEPPRRPAGGGGAADVRTAAGDLNSSTRSTPGRPAGCPRGTSSAGRVRVPWSGRRPGPPARAGRRARTPPCAGTTRPPTRW
jgi:hypothetical protein